MTVTLASGGQNHLTLDEHVERLLNARTKIRDGDYEGAYLAFPRWAIGIDLPDNSVCIADSKSLHCVTPIRGSGQRFTTVCYTDLSTATIGALGKPERLIGRFAKKKLEKEIA